VKHYGNHAVLQGVNFQAADGECMALNGANGAGKTTFLRHSGGRLEFLILEPQSSMAMTCSTFLCKPEGPAALSGIRHCYMLI